VFNTRLHFPPAKSLLFDPLVKKSEWRKLPVAFSDVWKVCALSQSVLRCTALHSVSVQLADQRVRTGLWKLTLAASVEKDEDLSIKRAKGVACYLASFLSNKGITKFQFTLGTMTG
jgi:hypothetical protein